MFPVGPYNWGFWWHIQTSCCYLPSSLVATQSTSILIMQSFPSLRELQPENRLCLWINAIYPLLQCQSSSSSVDKSIWREFRGPRFESWLDLIVFFCQYLVILVVYIHTRYVCHELLNFCMWLCVVTLCVDFNFECAYLFDLNACISQLGYADSFQNSYHL